MTIGEKIKQARQKQGYTLKEVQAAIKIRTRYLEALENDEFTIIPGEAYIKAFIKSYANFLDLDYMDLLNDYKQIKEKEEEEKEIHVENEEDDFSGNILMEKSLIGSIIIIAITIIIAILIVNIFFLSDSNNEINGMSDDSYVSTMTDETNDISNSNDQESLLTDREIGPESISSENNVNLKDSGKLLSLPDDNIGKNADNSQENNKNNESENIISDIEEDINDQEINNNMNTDNNNNENLVNQNSEQDIENNSNKEVEIIITEKSWIQINIDGENIYQGILNRDETRTYNYNDQINLKIGNAAGVKIRKNNEVLGPWGDHGEVLEKTIE
ncbi:MAG: helix-turn-helix domain-containing protein [Bacillota bacterium]